MFPLTTYETVSNKKMYWQKKTKQTNNCTSNKNCTFVFSSVEFLSYVYISFLVIGLQWIREFLQRRNKEIRNSFAPQEMVEKRKLIVSLCARAWSLEQTSLEPCGYHHCRSVFLRKLTFSVSFFRGSFKLSHSYPSPMLNYHYFPFIVYL